MPPHVLRLAFALALLPVLNEHSPLLADSYALPQTNVLESRDTSNTDICFRFSGQSALINGTVYIYGGQVSTEQGNSQGTWTNNFYSLDLTKSWQIANPALTGLEVPSGPPAVALGYLWHSHESLFLYGGEFSWKPAATVVPYSMWEYKVSGKSWVEHQNPTLSSGESAPDDGPAVQRAAEGAGANVPALGRGFYFGGHLDEWTTPGWPNYDPRVYLQSLLEFTFPGSVNKQVNTLSDGRQAGTYGNYRNITKGGIQAAGGFTARADGLLVYVPGFSAEGILIALAGGTNTTFTQMNVVDVYDISTSSWFRQSTTGSYPNYRVNPCAVVAAAADGSSYNIYMFGGQSLEPYGNQTQYQDMWILSVPSFTWIQVDQSGQSVPYGRSGHLCNIWDGQMIVIGGYTGPSLSCESPGIYTYDLSNLKWTQQFTAASSSEGNANPFSQQQAQLYNGTSAGGLEGSYNYSVPTVVAAIIGGGPTGGATLTSPVVTATGGPMATGSANTYSVTATAVAPGSTGNSPSGGSSGGSSSGSGTNIGAIVAGVIAGLLLILVCYLLFCTYVYRKRVKLYQRHAEMAAQQARGEKTPAFAGYLPTDKSESSNEQKKALFAPWSAGNDPASRHTSGHTRYESSASAAGSGYEIRRSGSSEDLLGGHEPTFVGVMLHPRRSLRVINHD